MNEFLSRLLKKLIELILLWVVKFDYNYDVFYIYLEFKKKLRGILLNWA